MSEENLCCFCDQPCNPQSQACGSCMRNGYQPAKDSPNLDTKKGRKLQTTPVEVTEYAQLDFVDDDGASSLTESDEPVVTKKAKTEHKVLDDEALSELADDEAEEYLEDKEAVLNTLQHRVRCAISTLNQMYTTLKNELVNIDNSIEYEKLKNKSLFDYFKSTDSLGISNLQMISSSEAGTQTSANALCLWYSSRH
jgi:hypothetical protein